MKRRQFIALFGGAAIAAPFVARAQERVRRVGVLMHTAADQPEAQARFAAFLQGLQESGWAVGRNVRIDSRWSVGDNQRASRDAVDLVALGPDVILAGVGGTTGGAATASRTVPIVFAQSVDPVGNSFVESLAQAGNSTGFIQFEYVLSGKWLELLKEMAQQIAGGRPARTGPCWDWTVGHHPVCGANIGRGVEADRVASAGEMPGIRKLTESDMPIRLALSLHAPEDGLRSKIMPVNERYSIAEVLAACQAYYERRRRMVFVEYVMLAGVNDWLRAGRPAHAAARPEEVQAQPDPLQPHRPRLRGS